MESSLLMGKEKMQVHDVPGPTILNPRDESSKITLDLASAAPICTCMTASFPTWSKATYSAMSLWAK